MTGSPNSAALASFVLTVGRANVELILGVSWSTARRLARDFGIAEMRVTERLVLIDAQALLAALRARSERDASSVDELELARRAMGLEKCA